MAQLLVRNVHPRVVSALRVRAARHGRSSEAEHREILEQALVAPEARDFKKFLRGALDAPALESVRSRDRGRAVVL